LPGLLEISDFHVQSHVLRSVALTHALDREWAADFNFDLLEDNGVTLRLKELIQLFEKAAAIVELLNLNVLLVLCWQSGKDNLDPNGQEFRRWHHLLHISIVAFR